MSSDGGGFFNANSAHPFENPTAATNLLEMVLIFMIGAGLTNTFGRMIGNERQGWALLAAMRILYAAGVAGVYAAEARGNPSLAALGINQSPSVLQAGGNMEGKEVRFGTAGRAWRAWEMPVRMAFRRCFTRSHQGRLPTEALSPVSTRIRRFTI